MKIAMCLYALHIPPVSGQDRHTTEMARALRRRGHQVRFYSWNIAGEGVRSFDFLLTQLKPAEGSENWSQDITLMQRKLQPFFGAAPGRIAGWRQAMDEYDPDVCIYCGGDGPAYLVTMPERLRIWYAADEALLAYVSALFKRGAREPLWRRTRTVAIVAAAERIFGNAADEIWMVSERDRSWMRRMSGWPQVRSIPNGVDTDFFAPMPEVEVQSRRLVFWGRLDFPVNEQALDWFLRKVWPQLRRDCPELELLVIGFSPSDFIRRLTKKENVQLIAGPPDLRSLVCSAPIAIFPFVSGAGIKNKFLEGASMSRAMMVTSRVVNGLVPPDDPCWVVGDTPKDWVKSLRGLLADESRARAMGAAARKWVQRHYTWDSAALSAEDSINEAARRKGLPSVV